MSTSQYTSWEDFYTDVQLMLENAKLYNRKGSQVYKDAVSLMVTFVFLLFLLRKKRIFLKKAN
jgi:hypothetical protein